MKELLDLCRRLNIESYSYTAIPNPYLPLLMQSPDWLFKRLAKKMLAISAQARSSMWDDIQARRRTEIMYLNGAVARLGIQTGIATPVNTAIVELIKHLETGERLKLNPAELKQRLLYPNT